MIIHVILLFCYNHLVTCSSTFIFILSSSLNLNSLMLIPSANCVNYLLLFAVALTKHARQLTLF